MEFAKERHIKKMKSRGATADNLVKSLHSVESSKTSGMSVELKNLREREGKEQDEKASEQMVKMSRAKENQFKADQGARIIIKAKQKIIEHQHQVDIEKAAEREQEQDPYIQARREKAEKRQVQEQQQV